MSDNERRLAVALAEMHAEGWDVRSEHDPGCPGEESYCANHCPVPVQKRTGPDELAAALLPVVAEIEAEARAEERERARFNDEVRRAQLRTQRETAELDLTRLHFGICPACHEDKFIGHGPLCVACFTGETP